MPEACYLWPMGKCFTLDGAPSPVRPSSTPIGNGEPGSDKHPVPPLPPEVIRGARSAGRTVDQEIAAVRVADGEPVRHWPEEVRPIPSGKPPMKLDD